ncbi:MAG: arylsulfatase [Acidobacteria bacterium]|nr:arylsulfatase [Acidobacteriota bacterium]
MLSTLSSALFAQKPRHPNLLLIMADDLGFGDVGFHGSEFPTPHIDRIAKQGAQFSHYYAYPLCSPTRCALLTGRSPLTVGIHGPFGPFDKTGLPLDEHTMAESFRAAGYQTWMVGKWHLGLARQAQLPHRRGFDHFYGHTGGSVSYFTHLLAGAYDWQRNGKSVREEGYTTELLGKEMESLIRGRDKSRPFFAYTAFNAPHTPLEAPSERIAKFAHIADENRRTYAAMVSMVDDQVGRLLRVLEEEKIAKDTMVVFLSDNGGAIGASNGPLREGKSTVFEGGIRVPAAMWYTGVIEGGKTIAQMVAAHDLFPTLAAGCGVKPRNTKAFYGRNLWGNLVSGKLSAPKNVVIGAVGSFAVFDGEWKYVAGRTRGGDEMRALFRIRQDPSEKEDVLAAHPEVGRRMAEMLAKLEIGETLNNTGGPGESAGGGGLKKGGTKKGFKKKGAGGGPQVETRPAVAESAVP